MIVMDCEWEPMKRILIGSLAAIPAVGIAVWLFPGRGLLVVSVANLWMWWMLAAVMHERSKTDVQPSWMLRDAATEDAGMQDGATIVLSLAILGALTLWKVA